MGHAQTVGARWTPRVFQGSSLVARGGVPISDTSWRKELYSRVYPLGRAERCLRFSRRFLRLGDYAINDCRRWTAAMSCDDAPPCIVALRFISRVAPDRSWSAVASSYARFRAAIAKTPCGTRGVGQVETDEPELPTALVKVPFRSKNRSPTNAAVHLMRLYHFPAKITRTAASCCIRYRALDSGATEPIFGITISDRVSDHGNDNWETTIVPFIPRLTIFLPGIKVIADSGRNSSLDGNKNRSGSSCGRSSRIHVTLLRITIDETERERNKTTDVSRIRAIVPSFAVSGLPQPVKGFSSSEDFLPASLPCITRIERVYTMPCLLSRSGENSAYIAHTASYRCQLYDGFSRSENGRRAVFRQCANAAAAALRGLYRRTAIAHSRTPRWMRARARARVVLPRGARSKRRADWPIRGTCVYFKRTRSTPQREQRLNIAERT